MKSAEEIMNILEAYDLTGSLRDAARAGRLFAITRWPAMCGRARRGRAVPRPARPGRS